MDAAIPPDCGFCAHNIAAKTENFYFFYVLRFRHEIRERKNLKCQGKRGIIQALHFLSVEVEQIILSHWSFENL